MLLLAFLGAVALIAAMGLVMLLSGANDFPGKPAVRSGSQGISRSSGRETSSMNRERNLHA